MAFKAIVFCAAVLLVQSISGQCLRRISIPSCSNPPRPLKPSPPCQVTSTVVPSSGGPLIVTSVSPIAPTGISLASELALAGDLLVNGALPFLSAVAFDGNFPTSGSGSVSYGCGDGTVGIQSVIGGSSGSIGGFGGCGCLVK